MLEPKRQTILDLVGIGILSACVIVPQIYLEVTKAALNWIVFVAAVLIPIALAYLFFWLRGRKVIFFVFMAYIWALTDDAPVNLDSVFTWPEVTFGLQHYLLEVLLHLLTAAFMVAGVREASKGRKMSLSRGITVYFFTLLAFIISYAQNLPFHPFEVSVPAGTWYPLDIIEHPVSILILCLALWLASTSDKVPREKSVNPANRSQTLTFVKWESFNHIETRLETCCKAVTI